MAAAAPLQAAGRTAGGANLTVTTPTGMSRGESLPWVFADIEALVRKVLVLTPWVTATPPA